jgi:hypothetical protein
MRDSLWVSVMVCGCALNTARAETAPSAASHLGLATQSVALPGAGQVIIVFLCVAALALGIAMALRRLSPGLMGRLQLSSAVAVQVLARQRLEPGVSLHIVSVAGERLAIVTSRSGVAVHRLAADVAGAVQIPANEAR